MEAPASGRGRPSPTRRPGAHRRRRRDRLLDDLRHRPAHPQGRRARGRAGHGSSATRPSAPSWRSGARSRRSRAGDRVLVSCITACGRCRFCREGRYGQCTGGGGWILGHLIDGLQAEYARVPFADTSVYQVPRGAERRAGAVPRRHPADGLRGRRAERQRASRATRSRSSAPGPIGLAAIMTARLLHARAASIAIDLADAAPRAGARRSAPT